GDDAAGDVFSAAVAEAHRLRESRVRVHAVEGRRSLTEVEIVRVRTWTEAIPQPGGADVDETARLDDTRGRLEQDRVHHGEDRRGRADADGERHHGGEREDRTAPQHPSCVPQVAAQVVDPPERARVAVPFPRLVDAAEGEAGGAARLVSGQTARPV